jgi:hypothetical protein
MGDTHQKGNKKRKWRIFLTGQLRLLIQTEWEEQINPPAIRDPRTCPLLSSENKQTRFEVGNHPGGGGVQNKNQNFHSLIYPNPEPIETRMKMGGGGLWHRACVCT